MKNQILERFSASGRLRTRFEEILSKVQASDLPRMDGGDQIGQLIVANLEALPRRTINDSALLFEAQKARAALYHESSGATTLEAAESLIAARATLEELNQDREALLSLFQPAQDIFKALVKIGSKRNAWLCLEIMITCLRNSDDHKELIPQILGDFAEFSRDMIYDGREPSLLNVLLSHCDWAREIAPDQFPEMVGLLPLMLEQHTDNLPWQDVLRAYLDARHLSLGFGPKTLSSIAKKMASMDKIDTEVRVVYQDFLCEAGDEKYAMEEVLRKLSEVDPRSGCEYDADLDSLNALLSEHFADREWVWRHRAVMSQRRDDRAGALAYLSRAMSIDGEPPMVMGLMAPVLAGMGFLQTAFQFARFATREVSDQFGLGALKLLLAEPETEVGCQRLEMRLERTLLDENLPVEFRTPILKRRAELLYRAENFDQAAGLYDQVFRENLSDEVAAVRLAEISLLNGETDKVETFLTGRFSDRVQPFVRHIQSRMAQANDDLELAWQRNEEALALMPEAQMAGRQMKVKTLAMIEDRIRAIFGESQVQCSLLAILQVETHAPPHRDLVTLDGVLRRRSIDLGILRGDVANTADRINDLVSADAADTAVFIAGAKASLENGRVEDALNLLNQAEKAGHGDGSEIRLMRGKTYMSHGNLEAAQKYFSEELEVRPNAEARLFLAMIELERDEEAEALVHLAKVREEDGGSKQVRYEVFNLKGILLERLGMHAEARQCYLSAMDASPKNSDAQYRAGILGLEAGVDDEGFVVDREVIEESLALLEGVKDSDAICRRALSRAATNKNIDHAILELERAMKRTNGADEIRLNYARLSLLLEHDRLKEALEAARDISKTVTKEAAGKIQGLIVDLQSRCALQRIARDGNLAAPETQQWLKADGGGEQESPAHKIFTAILDGSISSLKFSRNSSPAMRLAAAVAGGERRKDGKLRARVTADDANGIAASEAKNILQALTSGTAQNLLDAMDSMEAAGLTLPWKAKDVLSVVAAKSMSDDDASALRSVRLRAPGEFRDYEQLGHLMDVVHRRGADTTRVMNLLSDISGRLIESGSGDNDDLLQCIRTSVTEMRETPSPAWASARLRCAGKRTRVHEPSAELFWRTRFESGQDEDGEALHHLALMSISRAHESEIDGIHCPELWQDVHEIWGRLVEHNPFWTGMMKRLGGEDFVDVVSSIREKIAGWILHAQVALAKRRLFAGDIPQAIDHARIAAHSRLMSSCDSTLVRELIFNALCGDLEKHMNKGQYHRAMECIDRVIVADPCNPLALREMVMAASCALERNLAVLDSLRNPDESMLAEISSMMNTVLMSADRAIRELSNSECCDQELAKALITDLRCLAFVESRKSRGSEEPGQLLDRAIQIADGCGLDSKALRHVRSEIGLDLVQETISKTKTQTQEICIEGNDPLEAAMGEVDRLIAIDPGNIKVIAQKAKLLLVANRDEEAEALARNLFKNAQSMNDPTAVRAAVELMHQVQSEREKLRYDSKMEMVEKMCADANWRAALELFREAVVGRENEHGHLLQHVDILIGLRKVDRAASLIDSLEECESLESEWQLRKARLECIRYMAGQGGDMLSAFELAERGHFDRAIRITDELLGVESKDGPLQYLAARCHKKLGNMERALAHAKAAKRCAHGASRIWVSTLIAEEIQG